MGYKGGKRKGMSTKRRMRANKRRNTKRRNKGGQSMNPEENVNKKNYQDKKMELMEEGKPWYIPPNNQGTIVTQDDPGEFKQMNQKMNDELDQEEREMQGLSFGGKRRTKRRGVRRRKTRKSKKY